MCFKPMVQNPKVPGTGNTLTQLPLIIEEINLKRSLFPRVTSQKEAVPEQREISSYPQHKLPGYRMCHKRICTIYTVLYSEFQRAVDGLKQGTKDSGQTHILEGPFLVLTESRRGVFSIQL